MHHSGKSSTRHFTWSDYLLWGDDQRWEIIEGAAYAMSPAPSPRHQLICTRLTQRVGNYFEGKP